MNNTDSNLISILDIFNVIKELVYNVVNNDDFYVPLSITTEDNLVHNIIISTSKSNNFLINKNILLYKNKAINLNTILKVKILVDTIPAEFKNLLLKNFGNITFYNYKEIYDSNSSSPKRNTHNFNIYSNNKFNTNDNLQDYIIKNMKNIKSINYNTSLDTNHHSITSSIDKENILNADTNLDVKRKEVLEDIDLGIGKLNVINSIEKNTKNILSNLETEEKLVLTNNSEEIEVSRPINTENISVLDDLEIKNYNISIDQTSTKAIDKINQRHLDSITNITPHYLENTLSNINPKKQIIQTKTVKVLDLRPMNTFLDKDELDGKPLMLDPTGEKYIGVVLDDGTFEPLELCLKTFNVVEDTVDNLIGNISEVQLEKSLLDISVTKNKVLQSLDIYYNNNLVEYQANNIVSLKDVINTSKSTIKNITNEIETAFVVSKNNYDIINNIKNISYDTVENIEGVETTPVINSIELIKNNNNVINEVNLDKKVSSVVKDIDVDIVNNEVDSKSVEYIDGVIEFAGNGIMVVNNTESGITIYSIPKISSIN
ncbi:hypothetical protein [Paraclostridium bifermentans]|uniref:hypothetical protein n=1 Tax=Paraclostridium bifermentans TaxID=1490 RepID=UPI00359C8B14